MTKIKILSWNVNGLRAIPRKGFLNWFLDGNPDILCIQETKTPEDKVPSSFRNIDNYYSFFSSPIVKKRYSGVALYTKIKPNAVEYGFGVEEFDNEGRIIIADYDDFVLFNIYFPNGKMSAERLQYKMDFYDIFLNYTDKLKNKNKNIVVCGDLNTAHKEIDLARPKANEKVSGFLPKERAWIDKFLSHGHVDTFRMFNNEPEQYTWWSLQN